MGRGKKSHTSSVKDHKNSTKRTRSAPPAKPHGSGTLSSTDSSEPPSVTPIDFHTFAQKHILEFAVFSLNMDLFDHMRESFPELDVHSLDTQRLSLFTWAHAAENFAESVGNWDTWLTLFNSLVPTEHQSIAVNSEYMALVLDMLRQLLMRIMDVADSRIEFTTCLDKYLPHSHLARTIELNQTIAQHEQGVRLLDSDVLEKAVQLLHWHREFHRLRKTLDTLHRKLFISRKLGQPSAEVEAYSAQFPGRDVFVRCRDMLFRIVPPIAAPSQLEKLALECGALNTI